MNTVLEYKNITKQYLLDETIIDAIKGVSFSVCEGEFAAIVGPSGSGKSTLLHLGAGIDLPTSGTISLLGQDLTKINKKELAKIRNRKIGFIFQSFNLLPVLTVLENVEYPCLLYPETKSNRKNAKELLEMVGLKDQLNKKPSMLSGGQRQRVAIARALVNSPSIVFADEPTANLDHENGNSIMQLLKDLNNNLKTTFLFSTHDPKIMDQAKRIIKIEDGIIISDKIRE